MILAVESERASCMGEGGGGTNTGSHPDYLVPPNQRRSARLLAAIIRSNGLEAGVGGRPSRLIRDDASARVVMRFDCRAAPARWMG